MPRTNPRQPPSTLSSTAALKAFTAYNGNAYTNLAVQADIELLFSSCLASVAFFVSCKMTKILRFIAIFADTLDHAGISIKDFVMPFILIMCALNVSLYCLLWNKLERWLSFTVIFGISCVQLLPSLITIWNKTLQFAILCIPPFAKTRSFCITEALKYDGTTTCDVIDYQLTSFLKLGIKRAYGVSLNHEDLK
uniref:EXS domain-containing protein n=1 Tax=Angiostrongylus cantonensis TaxID=6313 RepID=A0A158P8M0_ANGCA